MSPGPESKDLVLLVPDKNIEAALKGLLSRPQSLGIRPVSHQLYVHPERDPGCLLRGAEFLRQFVDQYHRALIVLDQEGCGREDVDRSFLESYIEEFLEQTGWDRAAAIVIAPELESWVWSDSPRVDRVLGWNRNDVSLREWLREKGLLREGSPGGRSDQAHRA